MDNRTIPLYQLNLINREKLEVSGVIEVESFDEHEILAETELGSLLLRGEGLNINHLNLEEGKMVIEGRIVSMQYVENKKGKIKSRGKGVLQRLLK